MIRWLDYTRLCARRPESLSERERKRLAELEAEDERLGATLASWELPAILGFGVLGLVLARLIGLALF